MLTTENTPYKIRAHSTFYEDRLKIISYPNTDVVTWHISPTTKILVSHLLEEEYDDLHKRLVIFTDEDVEIGVFPLKDSDGIMRISHTPTSYSCTIMICNSLNEEITLIKTMNHHQFDRKRSTLINDSNIKIRVENSEWIKMFSAYSIYDERK